MAIFVALLTPVCAHGQEPEIEMGKGNVDFLMESTPMKPHENVYIEDVEAQVKEAHEEAKAAGKEVRRSEMLIKKVKAKNYGDRKHLQAETLKALERKKKADQARLKIWVQREALQREVLAYEKRRQRAKDRAQKAEESVEIARTKLADTRQTRMATVSPKRTPSPSMKKYRRVRVNFGDESKSKKGVADAY
ncbi:MAG: hypothetical protein ABL958_22055 [Bdellovibrionia bacterium]